MKIEKWNHVLEFTVDTDGCWIGYVDGDPVRGYGNEVTFSEEGDTFGINCSEEFILRNGEWQDNDEDE